jgi:hypothetical protein
MPKKPEILRAVNNLPAAPIAIEATVTQVNAGSRILFNFEHGHVQGYCFVAPELQTGTQFRPGQRVLMTGEWSPNVLHMFLATTVKVLEAA